METCCRRGCRNVQISNEQLGTCREYCTRLLRLHFEYTLLPKMELRGVWARITPRSAWAIPHVRVDPPSYLHPCDIVPIARSLTTPCFLRNCVVKLTPLTIPRLALYHGHAAEACTQYFEVPRVDNGRDLVRRLSAAWFCHRNCGFQPWRASRGRDDKTTTGSDSSH